MGGGPLGDDGIDLFCAVFCDADDLDLVVLAGLQIAAAFYPDAGLAVCRCAANGDAFRFIGQPNYILGIACTEYGGQQEAVYRNAGKIVIGACHIVGVLGPLYCDGIGSGASVFCLDGDGDIGGAVGSQIGRIDADGGLAVIGCCLDLQFAYREGNLCSVAGGVGIKGGADGGIADCQALQAVVGGQGRGNGGGVCNSTDGDLCRAVRGDNTGVGYIDLRAYCHTGIDLEGHGKEGCVTVDGVGQIVVIGGEDVAIELHDPGRTDFLSGAHQGQLAGIIGQSTLCTEDAFCIEVEGQGDGIACPDHTGAGEACLGGNRRCGHGKEAYAQHGNQNKADNPFHNFLSFLIRWRLS